MSTETKLATSDVTAGVAALMCLRDKRVEFETLDGMTRQGVVTAINTRSLFVDGKRVHIPVDFELNGEQSDAIRIDRVACVVVL